MVDQKKVFYREIRSFHPLVISEHEKGYVNGLKTGSGGSNFYKWI
jgi:hypothetical protein